MNLLSLYLDRNDTLHVVLSPFGVLTVIADEKKTVLDALSKLSQIKEDVMLVMDLINHKKSEFLEWIIIVLIGVEIVMGIMEMAG